MRVAVCKAPVTAYSEHPPYHPPRIHPELGAAGFKDTLADNAVYDAVRETFRLLGFDAANHGTAQWNPLGHLIQRGARVVIKPNFVAHEHGVQVGQRCLTTHGAVVRAMVDYAFIAGGPESSITIADAPVQGADFDRIVAQNGIVAIRDFYRQSFGFDLGLVDLRQVRAVLDEESALIRKVEQLPGDPRGYSVIDLEEDSRLRTLDPERPRYAVGDYDDEVTNRRHRAPHHEYVIANTVLDADVVLNVPKLKAHSKVGLTMSLKNMVGIVGSKDCLPHHRHGLEGKGGDEFPKDYPRRWLFAARGNQFLQGKVPRWVWRGLRNAASLVLGAGTPSRERRTAEGTGQQKFFPSGSWYGNDTIWRTVDDLNFIVHHWGRGRRVFTLADGIVSMEGNGPLKGSPRATGVILASSDPLALDVAAAALIGFDWTRINMLRGMAERSLDRGYSRFTGNVDEIEVVSNVPELTTFDGLRGREPHLPPAGWRNFVELPTKSVRSAAAV
ncbi:MAG TPA: DUF362 domain-containing protein [Thermoanaerobaculia bacterium]|nr:DUF362 domain-containing protein [Thermoanaerobaculia bacterium]